MAKGGFAISRSFLDGNDRAVHWEWFITPFRITLTRGLCMRSISCLLAGATVLFAVPQLYSQLPCTEACDINTRGTATSSSPNSGRTRLQGGRLNKGLIRCGRYWYFTAATCDEGRELWRTDGSAAGTLLVKDIDAGPRSSNPSGLTCCNLGGGRSVLLFAATSLATGHELYRTDGTAAGTLLVKDIKPGARSGLTSNMFGECRNGRLYFAADDGQKGQELWCSDGTSSGTVLIKDIIPGAGSSSPAWLKLSSAGSEIYFSAITIGRGRELWKTGGTTATTVFVKDIYPGTLSSGASQFTNHRGKTLFRAATPTAGTELWQTDGTPAGTTIVKDIIAGPGNSQLDLATTGVIGNDLFFVASDLTRGHELWKTDGTAAGTVPASNIGGPRRSSFPRELCTVGNAVYFQARGSSGVELYKYSAGRASLVKDIVVGRSSSGPSNLQRWGGRLLFSASTVSEGREPYISDGTAAGTKRIRDIIPGTGSSSPAWWTPISATQCVFAASDGIQIPGGHGVELWGTDGTSAGTKLLKDLEPAPTTASSSPAGLTSCWGNTVVFSASRAGLSGREPYAYNTTTRKCTLIGDINPGAASSSPTEFVCCGDRVYFRAQTSVFNSTGVELYEWNGSALKLHDLRPGGGSSNPRFLVCCNNKLFFQANDGRHGNELWMADPATGKVGMLKDLVVGPSSSSPSNLVCSDGKLYFRGSTIAQGSELWESDGTTAGTKLVRDIRSGGASSAPERLVSCTDAQGTTRIFFTANNGSSGTELFMYDGTNVKLVKDIAPGASSSSPRDLVCCDGKVYFSAFRSGLTGREPYVSDGTSAGTRLLKDIWKGSTSSSPASFTCCGKKVFFRATNISFSGRTGTELYVSDGTSAGTKLVKDIYPGSRSSSPNQLACVGNRVFFVAGERATGRELYVSDGTASGTKLLCDINVGRSSSNAEFLTACGGNLYFGAVTPKHGDELWMLTNPGAMVEVLGQGCDGIQLNASGPAFLGKALSLEGRGAPAGRIPDPRDPRTWTGYVGVTYVTFQPQGRPEHHSLFDACCWGWRLGFILPAQVALTKRWRVGPFTIPNVSALSGVGLFYQTYFYNLQTVAPVRASNGVLLTLGR